MERTVNYIQPSIQCSVGAYSSYEIAVGGICDMDTVSILTSNSISAEDTMHRLFGQMDPDVLDVKIIYDNGTPIGVKMCFSDGTTEKAICEEGDRQNFNLDFGITICLCKKLMGGSKAYNKKIETIRKEMERRAYEKALIKERERQEKEAKQKARQEEARKRREAREREIEIQKEAYLRAMREFNAEGVNQTSLPDHG